MGRRTPRLNSLLKEVISEVIHRDIHHNKYINEFVTITRVDITEDLAFAKVFVSVLGKGTDTNKKRVIEELNHLSRSIAHAAMKKVVMRLFPVLTFELDTSIDKEIHMEELLSKISKERAARQSKETS
ncbi:MAG TPA: 30S ribosome-binding factor RbfA [Chlamydiales bacterium]|nr:30S ribosome-binding factor RbfA [Chlamydiales bacterium]